MTSFAERIAALSPEQRKLLDLQLRKNDRAGTRQPIPRRTEASNIFPLSFAQQRLWVLDQLEPNNAFYNSPFAIQCSGVLDVAALQRSFDAMVQRHEALRTTFAIREGQPVQMVAPGLHVPLPVLDLRGLPAAARTEASRRLAAAEAATPFDLARGPLIRVRLLRLDATESLLLLTVHHIVFDGWSLGVLMREVAALYDAFVGGQAPPLAPLPIQYADFARWQREWLQGPALDAHLGYWVEQLAGAATTLDLPTDHPRPAILGSRGATLSLTLPQPLLAALTLSSQREGVTLFMTLLAAFEVLIARYTGQEDVLVGSPIANRTHPETKELIGCFVNTMVLRGDLAGNPSFRALLGRVREVTLEAYSHQDLPFEKLVEALRPERDLSRHPLFQVMFALQNAPLPPLELADLSLRQQEVEISTANFDLSLSMIDTEQGLQGIWEYNTDLFEAATIRRMAGHFQTLLEGIVADPERPIAYLPILTDAERRRLLGHGGDVQRTAPPAQRYHTLFEAHAQQTPDAIATVFDGAYLSYGELNRRANQLARHLQTLGVGPDMRVGLCMGRSLELVIGLLGTLKAGGAYVPIDPDYPAERITFMLDDSGATVLLLNQERGTTNDEGDDNSFVLRPSSFVHSVDLARDWTSIARRPAHNPNTPVAPGNLAYVIYTSGSTGSPKGVMIEHASLVAFTTMATREYGLARGDNVLQFTSISWDTSVEEIFPCLASGATLVLRTPTMLDSMARFVQACRDRCITVLNLPTAVWHTLAASIAADHLVVPALLRLVIIGGERVLPDQLALWNWHVPASVRLLNTYGLAEATVEVSRCVVSELRAATQDEREVPIGRPFPGVQPYVLDRYLQPVPPGVAGELYVGGAGLARGYLDRPELTAERFVPNPFTRVSGIGSQVLGAKPSDTRHPIPDTRLYKTGDLARYRADDQLEFVGRSDTQVKIRGYRVEPGEIETTLSRHPGVREVVVLAREELLGDKRLIAYIVPAIDDRRWTIDDGIHPDSSPIVHRPSSVGNELRSFLKQKLPDYMIPAAFVALDALPLTPNGKIDARALPSPSQDELERGVTYAPPRTPVEELLAGLWGQVLAVEQVGIHDNFFDFGGHSLLATQLISRVRETFQVELPLRAMFEASTVAQLAEQIGAAQQRAAGLLAPPILPAAREAELPLSFSQQRLWFIERLSPGNAAYNMPAALRLSGPLEIGTLRRSFDEVVRRHETLRTTFVSVNDRPVQRIAPKLRLPLPVLDLRALPPEIQELEIQRLFDDEFRRPFDLAAGPLVRATLARLGLQEHVLLLTMHHIITDGWSVSIFIQEAAALYAAFADGKPSPLPDLPIQYADYAAWQRRWLQGDHAGSPLQSEDDRAGSPLQTQLAYWTQHLADAPLVLELPTDRQPPAVRSFEGAVQGLTLPALLTAALKELSRREGITLFMALLAAFTTLLSRYSGQEDIVVGTPIAGRSQLEAEKLIGLFVNNLALRIDLRGNPTFHELARRVRETTLGGYAHQDLPFERLVEELNPDRDLSRNPIYDVMLDFLNMPEANLEVPALSFRFLPMARPKAKLAMTLYVEEVGGELDLQLVYQEDLYSAERMACLLSQLRYLLEQVVAAPDQPIGAYSLVAPATRALLPDPTAALDEPAYDPVTVMFAAWAQRAPEQPAIRQSDQVWTYGELAGAAQTIARALHTRRLNPGDVVAVRGPRSFGLIAGMLGVLMSGAVLLAIDPRLPSKRQRLMLQAARAKCLLLIDGEQPEDAWMHKFASLQRLQVDARSGRIAGESDPAELEGIELPQPAPDAAAYLFFTSGTTGTPKGVLGCHKGLSHFLTWQRETFAVGPGDRSAQLTGLSFDVVLRDIFLPLTSGATLCLPEEDDFTPERILTWLERERISLLHLVPTLAKSWLLDVPDGVSLRALRCVFFAGEPLAEALVRQWRGAFPEAGQIVNLYGPTETTLAKCWFRVPAEPAPGVQPVGAPLPHTQVLILADEQRLCGVGEPGEIVIRTPFRSLGYINAREEQRQRFRPNPFGVTNDERRTTNESESSSTVHGSSSGDLVYYTGDRGRYRPDGQIEILGREDQQVKIRGVRVELGEVEALLGRHPGVRAVVAAAPEDNAGEKRLVAYIIPDQHERPSLAELRDFVLEQAPEYLAPSAFVFIDALPLTPNGKVDRRALPPPEQTQLASDTPFEPPRTPTEELLAGVWSEVLGAERVGIHDNFFTLGGHSLLAIQVMARLMATLEVELPLRAIFELPTIAALSEAVEAARAEQALRPEPSSRLGDAAVAIEEGEL